MTRTYDYIIAGSGCAGLSLALQLSKSSLPFKRVLLIDQEQKTKNDRTWCYWSHPDEDWYPHLNFRSWNQLVFRSEKISCDLNLGDQRYHMIRGADFYAYCHTELKKDGRFEHLQTTISGFESEKNLALVQTEAGRFAAPYIFNSALRHSDMRGHHVNFVQHFKGWVVQTQTPVFQSGVATFMDFTVPQHGDCRFVYVLPFSANEALVEYTGFSRRPLSDAEYDEELARYLKTHLQTEQYQIREIEKGVIPMYESRFINPYGPRIISIGTAGEASKASTGFTFYFIQLQVRSIVHLLQQGKWPKSDALRKRRFHLYDRILLKVLNARETSGDIVFSQLFMRNSASEILDFLNEKTSLVRELRIISTVPVLPFLKAAGRLLFRR